MIEAGRPVRCFSCAWHADDFRGMNVLVGDSSSQTFFEILVLILAVELWAEGVRPTIVLGDNTAALQEALSLKGKGVHAPLSQALSVLMIARSLRLTAGHLPSEANDAADTLSRQAEPDNVKPWPFAPAQGVVVDTPLSPTALWSWLQ